MSNCDEDPTVVNTLADYEIVVDRPVAQVWKQFLDMSSWVTSHDIEDVQGTPQTVGSITRPSFRKAKELGMSLPHHHYCKIIRLEPERRYTFKTYSEKGGSYGMQITGFDDAHFSTVDGKTKITFHYFGESRGEVQAKDAAAMESSNEDDHMMDNLQNLKRIVESQ